jgi:hypothetical protein
MAVRETGAGPGTQYCEMTVGSGVLERAVFAAPWVSFAAGVVPGFGDEPGLGLELLQPITARRMKAHDFIFPMVKM